MVDARLPGQWVTDPVMDGLSDRAWRTFTGALMWSNNAGTDGFVPQRQLRFLHPENVDATTLAELEQADLFEPASGGVQVRNWVQMGQTLAVDIESRKEANRNRKRVQRKREKEAEVTAGVTRDVPSDVGQERTGQERTGQALNSGGPDTKDSWPVAKIGEGKKAS